MLEHVLGQRSAFQVYIIASVSIPPDGHPSHAVAVRAVLGDRDDRPHEPGLEGQSAGAVTMAARECREQSEGG